MLVFSIERKSRQKSGLEGAGAFSSALSSLIIVLDVLRDKKGRDWFKFVVWVSAIGCGEMRKNADYADAGVSRLRNASLSLAGSRPAVAAALALPKELPKNQ